MAMGLKGRWCPQNGGRWWHWGWRDVGVPKVWEVGGIGVGSEVGGIGVEGTLESPKWGTLVT